MHRNVVKGIKSQKAHEVHNMVEYTVRNKPGI